jgi:hypothetical protein
MGCLINGAIFTTSNSIFSPYNIHTFYDLFYKNQISGYSFEVNGSRNTAPFVYATVTLNLDSIAAPGAKGQVFTLVKNARGMGSASYEVQNYGMGTSVVYNTTNSLSGQLTFTRFDLANQVISGTFSFDAIGTQGDTLHVTNGRFDVRAP